MNRLLRRLNERGDTLVEVTMALAILALVLSASFAAANRAYLQGQNAKERSQLVSDAQAQAEALQSFRDSNSWGQFITDVMAARTSTCGNCFHMAKVGTPPNTRWEPAPGSTTDSQIGGQGYVRIKMEGAALDPGRTFTIEYGVAARGGGADHASSIRLYLTNMDGLRP